MVKVIGGRSQFLGIITSMALVGALGVVDYLTGSEFSVSLFYLLPIALTTWYVNFPTGILFSILCTVTWGLTDVLLEEKFSYDFIYFWNTMIRIGFFIITTYLISELHKTQKNAENLAHTDYITGTINSRYFHEMLEIELGRLSRYRRPFTLAYLDLDNFKQVNDRFGHDEGDKLIRFIADEVKSQLRSTDIVARLGGDEFAILFPETGQLESEAAMSKVRDHLTKHLHQKYPFISFSAGTVTYISAPNSVEEAIKCADELMYSVKNSTKNGIRYSLYEG